VKEKRPKKLKELLNKKSVNVKKLRRH